VFYTTQYKSPIGNSILASTESCIIGLWIEGQKYYGAAMNFIEKDDLPVLVKGKAWLDEYFTGNKPDIARLPLAPIGSEFRQEVWKILMDIPYGKVITYGEIAKEMAKRMGKVKMSAQAVGGAVGHNPISIIIPCHRVVGTSGSLTGYAGGIDKKIKLLEHECADMTCLFVPKRGTAL
jgi:methylated-DNA-[protein]-cysteine S-methyltransferase